MYLAIQNGNLVTLGAPNSTGAKARHAASLIMRRSPYSYLNGPRTPRRRLGCADCSGNCGAGMRGLGDFDWGSLLTIGAQDASAFLKYDLQQQSINAQAAAPYIAALNYQKQLLALQQQATAAAAKANAATGGVASSPASLLSSIPSTYLWIGGGLLLLLLARN